MKKQEYNTPRMSVVYIEPQQILYTSDATEEDNKIHYASPNSGIDLTTDDDNHVLAE